MSAIILQDEIVHYEVLGRGRPLLFLHGWTGSWRYWIPAMQAASVTFRAYALDLWGFGDTAKKVANYSLERQCELLELFLQELGIGKIALVGHGLGAIVAFLYTARCTGQVDRVMAIGLPASLGSVHPRLQTAQPTELVDWLLARNSVGEAVRLEAPKADPKAIQLSMSGLQDIGLDSLPAKIRTPCLTVYGQNDPAVASPPLEQAFTQPEYLHQIVFEQSGHFPMLDEPSKFNRLLADFLSLSSGTSPRQLQLKEEWKRRVR